MFYFYKKNCLKYQCISILLLSCILSPCFSKDRKNNIPSSLLLESQGFDSEEENSYITFSDFEFMKLKFDPGRIYISNGKKAIKIQDYNANELTKKYVDIVSVENNDKFIAIYPTKYPSFYDLFINYSSQGRILQNISNSIIKIKIYIPEAFTEKSKGTLGINFRLWDKDWNYYNLGNEFKNDILFTDIGSGWFILCIDFKSLKFIGGNITKELKVKESLLKKSAAFSLTFKNPRLEKTQASAPIIIDWIDITELL